MPLETLIDDNRRAIEAEPIKARAVFSVQRDLDVRGFFGFDDKVRPGFTKVRLEITPTGPESAERYQQLADAVDDHCPVLDLFTNQTPVQRRIAVPA